ncbi:MAG: DNA repair protein RecN [Flavobacteriaceae bacterium]|nr:DNA repair protein RecN [Flavobacteriaceae bacterium]MCY4253397.1 DNA repair protein RecN [Flavobacteriaceae bacterium]
MLCSLEIENYALIHHVKADFSNGMTCITGQTGSGKSIILGGLSLVLGKRADTTMIKDPSKKCIVEAIFEIQNKQLKLFFKENNLEYDDQTIIRREIYPNGKSRVFVNDSPVKLSMLENLCVQLIDIHSQRKTQTLLQEDQQLLMLDSFAQNSELKHRYQTTFHQYKTIQKSIKKLVIQNNLDEHSVELNKFLFQELQEAELQTDLKTQLESRLSELVHFEEIQNGIRGALHTLNAEPYGLNNQMIELQTFIDNASKKSSQYLDLSQRITALRIEIQELSLELDGSIDSLVVNQEDIHQINEHLNQINKLELKHRVQSVDQLIQKRDALKSTLDKVQQFEIQLEELKSEEKQVYHRLEHLAKKLTETRKVKSIELMEEVQSLTKQMGLVDLKIKMEFHDTENFELRGKDNLNFLIKINSGSPYKPLKKVVSGGELSRIMLALKTIISRYKNLPTVVFDEIDTGISGHIANAVARVMHTLSNQMQVITVTHLPQVAAVGQHHFKVHKQSELTSTKTIIKKLDPQQRINEIASMLSSDRITTSALKHAQVLLNHNLINNES